MVQLLAAKILTISLGEAQDFLLGNALRPAAAPAAAAPVLTKPARQPSAAPAKADAPTSLPTPARRPTRPKQLPKTPPTPPATLAEPAPVLAATTPTFVFQRPKTGFRAVAHWLPTGTMRVLSGSTAAGNPTSSLSETGQKLRQHLVASGTLKLHEGVLRFTQDYEFDSPNRAAEIVGGGAVNARISWVQEGSQQTLGSYLAGQAQP